MKKIYFIILSLLVLSYCIVFAADFTIVKSPQKVNINGSQMEFEVYNIDGNNFFKLRDIAYVLNGTTAQFSVEYNETNKMIEVKTGSQYISNGSEMKTGVDNSKSAVKSSQKISINGVEKELLAYNIAGNNFFKLRDLGTALNFEVNYNQTTNTVEVNSAKKEEKMENIVNITNIVVKKYHGIEYVELTSDGAITLYSAFPIYDVDNNRIVVDISNVNVKYANNQISVNDGELKQVRIGNQGNNVYRFVLDIESNSKYKVIQSDDKKTTIIALSETINYADLSNNSETNQFNTEKDNENQTNSTSENDRTSITSIDFSTSNDKLTIVGTKKFKYTESTLTNPYRIIFDIENAVLSIEGSNSITPKNSNISEIRFSQKDDTTVRVVIETSVELEFSTYSNGTKLEVSFEEPKQGLTYVSKKSYGLITLKDVKKDVFTTKSDSSIYQYVVKFSESRFSCDKETMKVNDDWVQTIKITTGKIIIQGQTGMEFTTKQDGNDVIITITKTSKSTSTSTKTKTKKTDGEFIVLIDAGHGGNDPGACNGTDYEKIYNLKIALKLRDLLEDSGITVYCSRTTDTYLDREDRVDFINEHDDADLFVSIHNNSSTNKNYSGTMVLYYDNDLQRDYGITSKEFAKITSKNLVEALDTKSWGIVSRDDLWVLTKSPLPAILCEVSFVSNDEELERLKTTKFQDAAANAIYESILVAKEQMEK